MITIVNIISCLKKITPIQRRTWEKLNKVQSMSDENNLKGFVTRLRKIVDDFESGRMQRESIVDKSSSDDSEGDGHSPNKHQHKVCFPSREEARRQICPCQEEEASKDSNEDPDEEQTSDDDSTYDQVEDVGEDTEYAEDGDSDSDYDDS